jgi:hypothetical protein
MMPGKILLSTAYFGNIQYYTKLLAFREVQVEQMEHFPKQTYRNRCVILDTNGPFVLSVPVKRHSGERLFTRDVEIDYSRDWIKMHLRALESAYRSSAFYDLLIDDLMPVWENQPKFLIDLNLSAQQIVCDLMNIDVTVSLTADYVHQPCNCNDLREKIHPKPRMYWNDPNFSPAGYHQIFDQKFGFTPNLSILDLLFNEGPEGFEILKKCTL